MFSPYNTLIGTSVNDKLSANIDAVKFTIVIKDNKESRVFRLIVDDQWFLSLN